jgi:hypothetical protein
MALPCKGKGNSAVFVGDGDDVAGLDDLGGGDVAQLGCGAFTQGALGGNADHGVGVAGRVLRRAAIFTQTRSWGWTISPAARLRA